MLKLPDLTFTDNFSAHYWSDHCKNLFLPDFSNEIFIGFSGNPFAERMSSIQSEAFQNATVSTSSNSLILIARSAQQGAGLAELPMVLGDQWPGLSRLSNPIEQAIGELWIVCHEDMRNNPRVRVAFDALITGTEQD